MIVGHAPILARLRTAVDRGSLHHALLFEGPAGVGKRRVAEWLAQLANCTSDGERPCGKCPTCRQIASGAHPDVIRLEPDPEKATAIIAVDRVREVIRASGYHRYNSRMRFVLIDPAEALQPSAANALLKTLEEPPAGTGFVLVATSTSGLLPTIRSRCQRVRFGAVPDAELVAFLVARGVEAPEEIARLSQGCPGRALAIAEEGLDGRVSLREGMLGAIAGDLGGLLGFSEKLVGGSGRSDWRPRVDLLIEIVEDLVRDASIVGSGADVALIDPSTRELAERWAPVLWPGGVAAMQRAVGEARAQLLANAQGRTVTDALLARLRAELGPARKVA
jgi:DNA polymerase III subunit delta'